MSYFERTASRAGPRRLVHQLLNGYGALREGELPGPWLVAALGELGHRAPAVRQMLRRMLGTRELDVRRAGRVNHYRLAAFSRAGAETARRKLFARGPGPEDWDGRWTLAVYQFRADEREMREHVRVALSLEGFGALARGVFLHPHDRVEAVSRALAAVGLADRVRLYRADRAAGPEDAGSAAEAWDLEALAAGYRDFERRFRPLAGASLGPREAFVASAATVAAFLELAFRDPELPPALLPPAWPGRAARRLARALLVRLEPGMLAFADALPGAGDARRPRPTPRPGRAPRPRARPQ